MALNPLISLFIPHTCPPGSVNRCPVCLPSMLKQMTWEPNLSFFFMEHFPLCSLISPRLINPEGNILLVWLGVHRKPVLISFFCFIFSFCFELTLADAQGKLLALHTGFIPGCAQGIIKNAGNCT